MGRSNPSPGWRVRDAVFEQSAARVDQCPEPTLPEIAFAGRSNTGKSSLINALCGRRALARVSGTPGRTQLLNVFRVDVSRRVGEEEERTASLRCVDLPGYGFAAAHKSVRETFGPMVEHYLRERAALRALILLVDLRRGLRDGDLDLLGTMSEVGRPTLIVGTKADKLATTALAAARRQIAEAVGVEPHDVAVTSAKSGLGLHDGGRTLLDDIADVVGLEADR